MENNDWRLQQQDKYLLGVALYFKKYSERRSKTDHDHCEFCWTKFSDSIPNCLTQGYTTIDEYRWICEQCYNDFKADFKWATSQGNPLTVSKSFTFSRQEAKQIFFLFPPK
jgi:hypothetical protein